MAISANAALVDSGPFAALDAELHLRIFNSGALNTMEKLAVVNTVRLPRLSAPASC